jgi:hypothetical protein
VKTTAKPPPWKKKNPKPPAARRKLSEAAKEMARRRAEEAGRPYPNLVDNMWAAKQQKPLGSAARQPYRCLFQDKVFFNVLMARWVCSWAGSSSVTTN